MGGEQEELKIVQLFLTRIAVSSFSLHERTVVLEIQFNDGSAKEIYRNTRLDNPQHIAQEILNDIVTLEENINLEFDGEQLTGAVNVVFHHYEQIQQAVSTFLEDLQAKVHRVRTAQQADGYLDMVRGLQNAELNFYG